MSFCLIEILEPYAIVTSGHWDVFVLWSNKCKLSVIWFVAPELIIQLFIELEYKEISEVLPGLPL
jgi:nitric oxide reductase large subunit